MKLNIFRKKDFLGINRRNITYLLDQNSSLSYRLVDDKLKTKFLLEKNFIPTPKSYLTIEYPRELANLNQIAELKEFVIKPASSTGGKGIRIIIGREENKWRTISGDVLTWNDIRFHVSNTLCGLYSLGGIRDRAFVEYRVRTHEILAAVMLHGVSDIRVLVYRGVPVMAMLRLPTEKSQGKANLHQGALGVGVDVKTGVTSAGVYGDRQVMRHPDTHVSISGVVIPFWQEILRWAVKTAEIFQLNYVGIDFVIDQALGPLVLELNARPGLSIQLANRKGLVPLLKSIDGKFQ